MNGRDGKEFLKKLLIMERSIRYIEHSKIDKSKWDSCIDNAFNSIIYSYSWYLDTTAKNWDALVLGDYEAVMPLPWRKKYGIQYIFQPYYTQQLGIFSISEKIDIEVFLNEIPKKFKHCTLNFNEQNNIHSHILRENKNFKLDISKSYAEIFKNYNRNCKRNLNKSEAAGFIVTHKISPEKFVTFVQQNLEEKMEGVDSSEYRTLKDLIHASFKYKKGELVGLVDSQDELHAAGFYLQSKNRLIFSVCASTKYGMKNQAMHQLVDSQIKKYCSQIQWYDFSGSNIKGVAYFNSTFGAESSTYKTILINQLPWWLKVFKK